MYCLILPAHNKLYYYNYFIASVTSYLPDPPEKRVILKGNENFDTNSHRQQVLEIVLPQYFGDIIFQDYRALLLILRLMQKQNFNKMDPQAT